MKKILFFLMIIMFVTGCGKESTGSKSSKTKGTPDTSVKIMTYDDIINLPVNHRHVDNWYYTLEERESKIRNTAGFEWYCPMIIKIKEIHNYIDWTNDKDFRFYPDVYGHTEYIFEVVEIADGYEGNVKIGDLIETTSVYYLKPAEQELYKIISEKTGKMIKDNNDLKEIDSFSFKFEPDKTQECTQYVQDDVYPLELNALYSCICWKNSTFEKCAVTYYYPAENQEDFIKILRDKYTDVVQGDYLNNCKEVSEMFK